MELEIIVPVLVCVALYIIIRKYYKNIYLRSAEVKQLMQELNIKPNHYLQTKRFNLLLDTEKQILVKLNNNEGTKTVYNIENAKACKKKDNLSDGIVTVSSLIIQYNEAEDTVLTFFDKQVDDPFDKRWLLIQIDDWKKLIDKTISGS